MKTRIGISILIISVLLLFSTLLPDELFDIEGKLSSLHNKECLNKGSDMNVPTKYSHNTCFVKDSENTWVPFDNYRGKEHLWSIEND